MSRFCMPWVNQTTQRPPLTTWFTVQWSEKPSAHGHHQIRRRLLPRRRPNPRIASPTLFTGASLSLGLNQLHGSRQHNSSHLRRCQQERDHRKWTASPAPIRNGRNRSLNQHHASRRPFVHPVQQGRQRCDTGWRFLWWFSLHNRVRRGAAIDGSQRRQMLERRQVG
jgi:hypothetical protein